MGCIGRVVGAFFLLCAFIYPATAEPRIALVIANGAYGSYIGPLANPAHDGKLIADTLQKIGFTVTLAIDLDQRSMKNAIRQFGEDLSAAGPTSTGLFYYVGHGVQIEGESFLIPLEAMIDREGDVAVEAVSAEAVLSRMKLSGLETGIIILDASRSNPFSGQSGSDWSGRLPRGFYIAQSTAAGEVAIDGSDGHSPFAAALAAEIVKPGRPIEEVFRQVRLQVMAATLDQQTPWDSSTLPNAFYFVGPEN